jgi:hypothetical protein
LVSIKKCNENNTLPVSYSGENRKLKKFMKYRYKNGHRGGERKGNYSEK